MAELYALTHRGNVGDDVFYARACEGARSVLELGTGFGRLLPALSRVSDTVVGLELDRALLALASQSVRALPRPQQKRLSLVRGDMQRFEVGRRFERILLPYNGLYCLLGRRAVLHCFRCVRAHLAPSGRFIGDIWAADAFHRGARARAYEDDPGPILSFCRGAETWDVFERSRLRRREQRLDVTYTYVSQRRGRTVTIRIDQRYLRLRELRDLLARAGLTLESVYGDFRGAPLGPRAEHVVFTARPA